MFNHIQQQFAHVAKQQSPHVVVHGFSARDADVVDKFGLRPFLKLHLHNRFIGLLEGGNGKEKF